MTQKNNIVNLHPGATIAPLKNVALCSHALERAIDRPDHLPGLIAFYGPSGWGKSVAAAYAANKHRAYYVEAKSTWTKKAMLNNILREMAIVPAKTIAEMAEQVSEQLALSGRPLIIDEMDHIVEKKAVEIVRDIYEGSGAPILLIGEEHLEHKLREWERFHNRMLDWVPAQPADLDDVKHLVNLYCQDVVIDEALLDRMRHVVNGGIRRIVVNIEKVRQFALGAGLDAVTVADWGTREFYTGEAAHRRV